MDTLFLRAEGTLLAPSKLPHAAPIRRVGGQTAYF